MLGPSVVCIDVTASHDRGRTSSDARRAQAAGASKKEIGRRQIRCDLAGRRASRADALNARSEGAFDIHPQRLERRMRATVADVRLRIALPAFFDPAL